MRLITGDLEHLAVETAVMKEMDRRTIEEFGVPGAVLMENAGSCAVEVALGMAAPQARVLILAGAGNNAGDGFVAARHLANRGFTVHVITAVAPEKYKGDAELNFHAISRMGVEIGRWPDDAAARLNDADFVIDALLGTGLSGPLREPFGEIIARLNAARKSVLAVDVPSGLDGDSGEVATAAVEAAGTVTFGLPKTGLFKGEGPRLAGEVVLGDIEMPRAVYPAGKIPDRQ